MQITENLEIGKCVRICTKFNFEFVPIFSLKMSVFFDTAILFDNAIYTHWAAKNVFIWMVRLGVGIQTSIILEFL